MKRVCASWFSFGLIGLFVIGLGVAPSVAKADTYETLNVSANYTGLNEYNYPPFGYYGDITGTIRYDETTSSIAASSLTVTASNAGDTSTPPLGPGFPLSWNTAEFTTVAGPVGVANWSINSFLELNGLTAAGGPLDGAYIDIQGPTAPLIGAVTGTVTVSSILATPEPGLYGLMALGMSGLALALRRRKV